MANKQKALNEAPPLTSAHVMDLPQPPMRNAEEYLKAFTGYVYTAVGAIAQEVASVDIHLYTGKFVKGELKTTEVIEHPALSILHYVNDYATLYDLIEATQIYMELTGEAFWCLVKDRTGIPREIWVLRPDWVRVIPSETDVIAAYDYLPGNNPTNKVRIPKENIIHYKNFNPLNPYRGKGSVQAAALPFDILNYAQEYNRNFFFNSAIPSMVFTTTEKVNDAMVKRFLSQWQQSFGGRTKSNKVAFLGNGVKLEKASFASKELDFIEQMKQMRDDVLAVFKVPKTILGLTEDVNRANAEATTRAFMERVVTPRMRRLVEILNEFFLPAFKKSEDEILFFDFTDPAPEDTEMKLKRYENARQNNWMTPNEIRAEENLPPLPGGDDLFSTGTTATDIEEPEDNPDQDQGDDNTPEKPTVEDEKGLRATLIKLLGGEVKKKSVRRTYKRHVKHMVRVPVKRYEVLKKESLTQSFIAPLKSFISDLMAEDVYNAKEKENTKSKKVNEIREALVNVQKDGEVKSNWTQEMKEAYWRQFVKTADETVMPRIKDACVRIFEEQEKLVMENLEAQVKEEKKLMGLRTVSDDIIPTQETLDVMWRLLEDILREAYLSQGEYVLDFLGVGGQLDVTSEFASWYLNDYAGILIAEIDSTTRLALGATLDEGLTLGESIAKLATRVRGVFEDATKSRAEAIARTESIKAMNSATVQAYRQSGVVIAKEWLTELDNRACPHCVALDGKAISLNKNFFNKGDKSTVTDEDGNKITLDIKFVDVGEPPLHVRCRCTTIPVIGNVEQ